MKKHAVLLSAIAAALFVASAQAQDSTPASADRKKGPETMLGSDKKTPAAPAADTSKAESKLGSSAKSKAKATAGGDGTKSGAYGVGLKKVPRAKTAKPESASDTPAK